MQLSTGLYRLLEFSGVYDRLQSVLRKRTGQRYVKEYIRPFDRCRILDIGCGTGSILQFLPENVHYVGFDLNPDYILTARKRYGQRGKFLNARIEALSDLKEGAFDIALASGVLHHIDDKEAAAAIRSAYEILRPGGNLVTLDPAYVAGQPWLARGLISRDRGKNVRTPESYLELTQKHFPKVESWIVSDLLRIPYTHFVMRCEKPIQ